MTRQPVNNNRHFEGNLESFENGLGLYNVVGSPYVNATAARSAAHDGSFGLDVYNSAGWLYRNDAAAQAHQGETLSAWVEFAYYANGRAYFGFGASATGTLSVVLAANTGQLIIQDNSGYGFTNLAAVPQYYQPNQWYRVEVVWGTGGSITAHLYGSNGTTLLNTVQATATAITAGGIAFRGIGFDKLFDTVTVTPNGSSQAAGLTGGTSQLLSGKSPAASPPSVAVVARLPVTSESVGMVFLLKPPGRRAPGATDPLSLP